MKNILIISILFFSCNDAINSNLSKLRKIEEIYQKNIISNQNVVYLIIPVEGCSYCIEPTIEFAKKNRKNERILYVLADFRIKLIRVKFELKDEIIENVIIDSKGYAYTLNLVNTMPVAYFLNEKGVLIDSLEVNFNNRDMIYARIFKFIE